MTINTRTRFAVLGVAGLAAFATAAGGASAAEAAPGTTSSQVSYPISGPHDQHGVDFYASISNIGSLQASDFSVLLECSDGALIPVSGDVNSNMFYFSGIIPDAETGHTCTTTVTVDQVGRSIQLENHEPFTWPYRNVRLVGTMPTVVGTGRGQQY